jgi:hypothetical protein
MPELFRKLLAFQFPASLKKYFLNLAFLPRSAMVLEAEFGGLFQPPGRVGLVPACD